MESASRRPKFKPRSNWASRRDSKEIADSADRQQKPCYDQAALMRRYDTIAEICDAMQLLGWQPYQSDHEDANGQFEMNWQYDGALVTADRHSFFKYMIRSIGGRHGLRATFMPNPFGDPTGNGCHLHVSLWTDGKSLFDDPFGLRSLSGLTGGHAIVRRLTFGPAVQTCTALAQPWDHD